MTTTTQVYFVCDCSGSMAGALESKMREMLRETVAALAQSEPGQRFACTVIPFSNQARKGMPWSATELLRHPNETHVSTNRPYGGGTALFDAMGLALEAANKELAKTPALIMVFTDGEENASFVWNAQRLGAAIKNAETTGNLTLTVAGPAAVGRQLQSLGLVPGNFRVWDGTVKEMAKVQAETRQAITTYTTERSAGKTRSTTLYADASNLTPAGIKANTKLVTPQVDVVSKRMAGRAIADFFGKNFTKGAHFYQLVKSEKIQEGKDLVVYIKDQDEYRLGSRTVRILLGLPETGEIRVAPSTHNEKYIIFVQSDSVNRKVVEGQIMLTVE